MTLIARILASLTLLLGLALPLHAQDAPAMLVADSVYLDGKTRLVAQGRVEALAGESRITASKITYDRATEQLTIEGPIRIEQDGDISVLASSAEMDPRFQNAILRGARLVLNQQVQLAAYQMNRVNGRYSQLYKTAVTSCHICNAGEPPLWQIRARRVIHDQAEKQLYFEGAQLRVRDVPIFYLPYLRLPDPTLERASGFMIPSLSSSSTLGTGVRLPYFIKLGDHRDLTLAPYLRTKSRSLEFRYRQAFLRGDISFEGAYSRDDLLPGETRGYFFGGGAFSLQNDYQLSFDIEATLDDTYLVDYSYSSKDRLDSEIALTRAKRDSYTNAALVHYYTLRTDESNSTIPSLIADFAHERRYFPRGLGGELRMSAALHSHYRSSDDDTDSDLDGIIDGRDVTRLGAEVSWRRNWTLRRGLQAQVLAGVAADQFYTAQDSTRPSSAAEITPMAALTLRWPLQKFTKNGAQHIVEPFMQIGWVGGTNSDVANDESTRVEFDEGNLLSLSHFPAADRRERGASLSYGVNWSRTGREGWESTLTMGHILRQEALLDASTSTGFAFSSSSGLSGKNSDVLLAGQLRSPTGLALTGRALFGTDLDLTKAEARGTWQKDRFGFGASYVWLDADADEDRTAIVAELSLDGLYRFSRHWTGTTNMRYDVTAERAAEAGVGLQYRNECVKVDLSLSRRFTSSTILTPSTEMSLTVGLLGFNASSQDKSYARKCKD
ncbi:LPS-assembly protein LptD [Lentibacter sp. XHP0401]|uniref:LPS-assembly protein LptD n=1 Tax=Lentibacter sp. XHP0401 TaxID=2984334 RepID=UPI0021E7C4D6|nr:LPS assembly protein LptD [Lentibacter sp. XHP0401]MCV2891722.1 LPS assembly protein LptD [Lentibacter sp. XHP0401]